MPEQAPGTFDGEPFEDEPIHSARRVSFEEKLRQEIKDRRAVLTPERVNQAFLTEDLRRSFNNIKAETLPAALAIVSKQEVALEINEKKLIETAILREYPLIYAGSGHDVEYPLVLGARKIIMLDPIFKELSDKVAVRQKLEKIVGTENVRATADGIEFYFDFGEGPETVSVAFDSRVYTEKGEEGQPPRFSPPEKIGVILSHQGADPSSDGKSFQHLVTGGYVISNLRLEKFRSRYFSEHPIEDENFLYLSVDERRELMKKIYGQNGLTTISLECRKDNDFFTFCSKE